EKSFKDVHTYFLDEFSRIHRDHWTMATVPSPLPPSEILDALVEKSSGYFIYASTVIKFVDDKRFRPVERLDIILGIKNSISGSPFDPLDELYRLILRGVPMEFQPQLLGILAVIAAEFHFSCSQIEQLLELDAGNVRLIPRGLRSVISGMSERDLLHKAYYASFLDFLGNPSQSGPFYVGTSQCHTNLTWHSPKALSGSFISW
ncbi:hypothetical protein C8J57DRAFT_1067092, partial [Mycena rebaudengoi]